MFAQIQRLDQARVKFGITSIGLIKNRHIQAVNKNKNKNTLDFFLLLFNINSKLF